MGHIVKERAWRPKPKSCQKLSQNGCQALRIEPRASNGFKNWFPTDNGVGSSRQGAVLDKTGHLGRINRIEELNRTYYENLIGLDKAI